MSGVMHRKCLEIPGLHDKFLARSAETGPIQLGSRTRSLEPRDNAGGDSHPLEIRLAAHIFRVADQRI
jgi:hypothetical protein